MKRILLTACCLLTPLAAFKNHTVDQKNREFSMSAITIKVGDSIEFTNSDDVAHNVYSSTPTLPFDLQRQAPGGKTVIQFPKAGILEVRCSIHPKMKLLVNVKP